MAASDNVVRSGLTPKHKDVDTLVSMLTYNSSPAKDQVLLGESIGETGASKVYDPPIEEFTIIRTTVSRGIPTDEFPGVDGPSILICTEGAATLSTGQGEKDVQASKGHIFFLGAGVPLKISGEGATFYRAYCAL